VGHMIHAPGPGRVTCSKASLGTTLWGIKHFSSARQYLWRRGHCRRDVRCERCLGGSGGSVCAQGKSQDGGKEPLLGSEVELGGQIQGDAVAPDVRLNL